MERAFITVLALLASVYDALAQDSNLSPTPSPTIPILHIPPGAHPVTVTTRAPKPDYPLEARKRHWGGVGWFLMHIDQNTGAVTSVEILESTGHAILDQASINALNKWRFKPRKGVTKVKTPIKFTMLSNQKA